MEPMWDALSAGEIEILIDGLSEDVSFEGALVHLGIWSNAAAQGDPPNGDEIATAFVSFERLVGEGYARLGRIEPLAHARRGPLAPLRHVEEPTGTARRRVGRACRRATATTDWACCCWIVNTQKGDAAALRALNRDA